MLSRLDFERSHQGMDFRPMTPPCFNVTYFNPDTQKEFVLWLQDEIDRVNRDSPPYIEVEGIRRFGIWEILERL
jgi:hypothetical protein